MSLIAKPIIKNQFWVITDGDKKVGNVEFDGSSFNVKIGKHVDRYEDTKEISNIRFETISVRSKPLNPVFAHFPTPAKTFNNILDVRKKLHLFTKTAKSKCFYAAGWFAIKQNEITEVVFCPKYIFVQRYPYSGPYKTKEEANVAINNLS
jgi:hypothetical protein